MIVNFFKGVFSDWWVFGLGSGAAGGISFLLGTDSKTIIIVVIIVLWVLKCEARFRDLESKVFRGRKNG